MYRVAEKSPSPEQYATIIWFGLLTYTWLLVHWIRMCTLMLDTQTYVSHSPTQSVPVLSLTHPHSLSLCCLLRTHTVCPNWVWGAYCIGVRWLLGRLATVSKIVHTWFAAATEFSCVIRMADTSSYTIEKRLVASVWVHERQHMGQTMS